ncbi:MAG TPA: nickel-dependent lactate racemase [Desulfobacteraceae bacterium]|nr:nickel-dependent lactate racemase [Desulfobacteraceae bacterium]
MKITLETGRSHIALDVPEDRILGILEGKDVPALPHDTVRDIITRGILRHAPADIGEKKIAVIIPDDTRMWARGDLFVPGIIDTLLDMGAAPENIAVIIALGTHRDIPRDRFELLCGKDTAHRVRVVNSAGLAPDRLVEVGTTPSGTRLTITREAAEADHIIIFGGILHHMLAGYGGGRKYILPGVAGEDAIQANHALAVDKNGIPRPEVRQAVTDGNPVHQDMKDGADIFLAAKTCTYAAVAANGRGNIFYAHAGDLHPVFEKGCRALDEACCTDVGQKASFAMFSAGGHRTDGQLYQATKALFNAVEAVEDGGSLLFVAGCNQGVGNAEFADALQRFKGNPGDLGRQLAQDFRMPAYVALRVIDILQRYEVTLVSNLDEKETHALGFAYTASPRDWIWSRTGNGYVIPFAENILPRVITDG